MRRNPSTVVVLAGQAPDAMLAAVGRSMNVVLVRLEESGPGSGSSTGSSTGPGDVLEVATGALRRAAGISSPYVLVAADPLAALAAEWRAMWEIPREVSREPRGAGAFELRAAEALAAWRAGRFELPDYYLVLAADTGPATPEEPRPGFYPGPLRSVRPHRVSSTRPGGSTRAPSPSRGPRWPRGGARQFCGGWRVAWLVRWSGVRV